MMISTRNIALFGIYKEEKKRSLYTAKIHRQESDVRKNGILQRRKYFRYHHMIIYRNHISDCLNTLTEWKALKHQISYFGGPKLSWWWISKANFCFLSSMSIYSTNRYEAVAVKCCAVQLFYNSF